jgi:hypothetical protein
VNGAKAAAGVLTISVLFMAAGGFLLWRKYKRSEMNVEVLRQRLAASINNPALGITLSKNSHTDGGGQRMAHGLTMLDSSSSALFDGAAKGSSDGNGAPVRNPLGAGLAGLDGVRRQKGEMEMTKMRSARHAGTVSVQRQIADGLMTPPSGMLTPPVLEEQEEVGQEQGLNGDEADLVVQQLATMHSEI